MQTILTCLHFLVNTTAHGIGKTFADVNKLEVRMSCKKIWLLFGAQECVLFRFSVFSMKDYFEFILFSRNKSLSIKLKHVSLWWCF